MPQMKNIGSNAKYQKINPFKGYNLAKTQTQIDNNESPDLLNVIPSSSGDLNKRTGYEWLVTLTGPINALFEHNSELLIVHGTKLSKRVDTTTTEIYSGLNNTTDITLFSFGGKCYIIDGVNYLVYDGSTVSAVVPYIPTIAIAGNVPNEDFNLIGTKFKQSFSGNATNKIFALALQGLDVTTVTATIDNVTKTETTDFTVDRTNGIITFITAPVIGTNNVIIQASKTVSGLSNRIKKCSAYALFGGANDSRVFLTGNKDYPNEQWRSGVNDPTYFPENGNYIIGADSESLSGFVRQYDSKIDLKTESIWNMRYEINSEGTGTFPNKPINDKVGAYAPKSIQLLDNRPTFLSKLGVYQLTQSNVRDESNVKHISFDIDRILLAEQNLNKAISVDFDRKYWLALNNRVYVCDYTLNEWYVFDNISATCFLEYNGELYFGSTNGKLYRFKKENHPAPYNDDGVAINAYWKSKQFSFDADELLKDVETVYLTLRPDSRMSVDISYETNKKVVSISKSKRMDTFSFLNFDFTKLTFLRSKFPQEVAVKIGAKKVTHIQFKFSNNKLDENLGIENATIKFRYGSKVR